MKSWTTKPHLEYKGLLKKNRNGKRGQEKIQKSKKDLLKEGKRSHQYWKKYLKKLGSRGLQKDGAEKELREKSLDSW